MSLGLFSQKMSGSYTLIFSVREREKKQGMQPRAPAGFPGDCEDICISDLCKHNRKLLEGVSLHAHEENFKN